MHARWGCACLALVGALSLSCAVTTNPPPEPSTRFGPWSESKTFVLNLRKGTSPPSFALCFSDETYQVAEGGDFAALQRAAESDSVGDECIVSFVGRERHQSVPVHRVLREVAVDQFLAVWPEETCQKAGVRTTIDNTYWKLVELNGRPLPTHEGLREAHLMLRHGSDQVRAFGGCDWLEGRYQVIGSGLHFTDLKSTEAACPSQADERAFVDALSRVTNYQSVGESLQLRDDKGPIARLRAVYFR